MFEIKKTPSGIIYEIPLGAKTLKLYDKQYEVFTSRYPTTLFNGGLGTGKSVVLTVPAIIGSLKYPGSLYCIASPTLKMAKGATVQKALEILETHKIYYEYNKSEMIIYIPVFDEELGIWRDSRIHFMSILDFNKLRGFEFSWVMADEINYVFTKNNPNLGREALKTLKGRARYLDPLRFDNEGKNIPFFPAKTTIGSTPKGKNWLYEDFYKEPLKGYRMVHATSYENPFLSRQYLADMEATYHGVLYDQEILGLFTAHQGMVFDIWDESVHVISEEEIERKIKNHQITHFAIGKDWGFEPDPGVSLVFGIEFRNGKSYYYLMEEKYETRIHVSDKKGGLDWLTIDAKLIKKYRDKGLAYLGMYADKSEKSYREQYEDFGFELEAVDNSIERGIQTIHSFLGAGRLFICLNAVNTIKEFELYQRLPNGQILDAWNHSIDSCRYVIHSREFLNLETIIKNK
jgi:hypothetical protein